MKIDDTDLPDDIRYAARRLHNDPAFEAAMKYLEMACWLMFAQTAPDATDTREVAYHQYSALQQLRELIDRWSRNPTE